MAKGYTVTFCEMKDDQIIRTLETIHSDNHINAGDFEELNYNWTVSDTIDGVSLGIEITEGYMSNSSLEQSEQLKLSPDIVLDGVSISQKDDGFYLYCVAANNGNTATSESDNLNVVYYPEKAPANMLGIEDEQFAKVSIGGIAPGESREIEIKIDNINGEMFNAYGYLPVLAAVTNEDEEIISNDVISYMIMENPIDIKVNNANQIIVNEGESVDLLMTYGPSERFNDVIPTYYTEDSGTAVIIDNQLIGVSAGNTTLVASAQPYGSSTEIEIIVNETNIPEDTTTETTTESNNRTHGSGAGSSKAASATTEPQTEEITESTTENIVNNSDIKDAFIDISEHWGREIINEVAEKNIVSGYEDNTFKPDNSITRAEFLTILYNSGLADTSVNDGDISFADVKGNEWYYDYVKWGAVNDLIVGYEDNTFRGNDIITRQEMAVVIGKFIKLTDMKLDENEAVEFADEDNIAPWAKDYVDSISAYGIVRGDNNNCYLPGKDLTRAETAVIINQLTK